MIALSQSPQVQPFAGADNSHNGHAQDKNSLGASGLLANQSTLCSKTPDSTQLAEPWKQRPCSQPQSCAGLRLRQKSTGSRLMACHSPRWHSGSSISAALKWQSAVPDESAPHSIAPTIAQKKFVPWAVASAPDQPLAKQIGTPPYHKPVIYCWHITHGLPNVTMCRTSQAHRLSLARKS